MKFIAVYKRFNAYLLTQAGIRFLDTHVDALPPYIKPTYRESYIIRRLRIARLMITAYRAGISVYRARMTSLALGSSKTPAPKEHPEWDAMYNKNPFVMAADMDLHRIDTAAESAKADGYDPICLVALKGQVSVLRERYKATGMAQKIFTFSRERPEVKNALALYTPQERQFETEKGEVIHVPPIQASRRAPGAHQKSARKLDHPTQK